jgi:hypothetical protein
MISVEHSLAAWLIDYRDGNYFKEREKKKTVKKGKS